MKVAEIVKLNDWLNAKRVELEQEGSSFAVLSQQATIELGFKVTAGSIKSGIAAADINLKRIKLRSPLTVGKLHQLCLDLANDGIFTAEAIAGYLEDEDVPQDVKDVLDS